MTLRRPLAIAAAAASLLACQPNQKSSAGFRLPDGDPVKGQAVFVQMRCHDCHKVRGIELPAPAASPPAMVDLGGEVPYAKTDGELITSIINPSHRIAPGWKAEQVQKGDTSRMRDYGEILNIRQTIDLVAFLQSRYKVVRPNVAAP